MSEQTEDQRRKEREYVAVRLNSLQRVDGNKHCADCGERAPKWASWNLGVFICLQCAGLHRNHLGAHISKIKSVNLDAWTEEHVANMEQMGNIKANAVYEANLPEDFERPQQNEAERKSFLIDKYQLRKYTSTNGADYSVGTPTTNGGETSSSEKATKERELAGVRVAKLLQVDGNNQCADCGVLEPKWASWNLGIFICFQCAGMHRCVLGAYISKLRPLDLTSWTEEEVTNMEQMGNIKANAVYEANLPESFERPQDNEALMKSFIKDKYELRKYMSTNVTDYSIGIPPKHGGESSSSEKGSSCNVL